MFSRAHDLAQVWIGSQEYQPPTCDRLQQYFLCQKFTFLSLLAQFMFFLLPKRFSCPDRIWCIHVCGRMEPWQRVLRAFQSREKSWATSSGCIESLRRLLVEKVESSPLHVVVRNFFFTAAESCYLLSMLQLTVEPTLQWNLEFEL